MTKPTGRPVGRPKTKEYKTILARIPKDLHDQVTRYATRHQQSISELIRDGLVWRLDEGDPHQSLYRAELANAPLHPGLVLILEESDVIQEPIHVIQDAQQRQPKRKTAKTDPAAAGTPTTAESSVIHNTNNVLHKEADPSKVENLEDMLLYPEADSDQAVAEVQPTTHEPSALPTPDYDASKYTLGALCVHRHEHSASGQSLRRLKDNECLACQNARKAASRQRKRQAASVA